MYINVFECKRMYNHVKDYECKNIPGGIWTSMKVQIWNLRMSKMVQSNIIIYIFEI